MTSDEKTRQSKRILSFSILTAFALAVLKFVTGIVTGSMAILASALDSAMDAGVSTVNFIAANEAAKPPDAEHKYGHGKVESLAGLFQSLIISVSGLYVVVESVKRLFRGSEVRYHDAGIVVMLISALATIVLVWRLHVASKKYKSIILSTEKLHFTSDILTHGIVITALGLSRWTGLALWDLALSIAVAVYIFQASCKILKRSVDELLDRSLDPNTEKKIRQMIQAHHASIMGLHDFRSRQVGDKMFLDFHIEIQGETDFEKAHNIAESLVQKIKGEYTNADVTVHYDPEGAD